MESLLIALAAFSIGVYNAEKVREVVPILDPKPDVNPPEVGA